MLNSEPSNCPDLYAGQTVNVKESEVFDYIRHFSDGTQEGNETAALIERSSIKSE